MKVCFISGVISRSGGTERVGSMIANILCERGYEIYLLSYWNQGEPYYALNKDIEVYYLLNPKMEGKLYRTYLYPIYKLHRFLKKNEIDIVIDIDTELAIYTAYAIKGTDCKWISWEHFNYWTMLRLKEKRRFRAKKLIKKYADNLVVLTEEDRREHIKIYGVEDKFITTIYNPCVSAVQSNYSFDEHIFLSVGRLVAAKGYDLLLEAWEIFCKTVSDWRLVIVGQGELETELLSKKNKLKLKNVLFAGHSDNVEEYYSSASCYVMSSRYEGFPMVILEAQSYALPTISFDCKTGPNDLINDSNGILVKNGDVKALANQMINFTRNRDNAIRMSVAAKESVKKFDVSLIADKWEKLLKSVY